MDGSDIISFGKVGNFAIQLFPWVWWKYGLDENLNADDFGCKERWMQSMAGLARQYNQEQAVGQGAHPPWEYIQIYNLDK